MHFRSRFALAFGVVGCLAALSAPRLARADDYQPAPADKVAGYFAAPLPCTINHDNPLRSQPIVKCAHDELQHKSLRELSILRNTIYARWGWDGFRKVWLHDYFHAQPWFRPNPKFHYRLLSDADRTNAHLIATVEQSFTSTELGRMRDRILKAARVAKRDPSPNDQIELGLIARAMGEFAIDDDRRGQTEESLDRLLTLKQLRQLSLRDLRLLRNTIYARRGRPFKSQILRTHFSGMDWYHLDPAYSDARLTKTDQRNIALIRSVENQLGGPLSDEDWLTEPATDGA